MSYIIAHTYLFQFFYSIVLKVLGKIYSILRDKDKRAIYDEDGSVDEEDDTIFNQVTESFGKCRVGTFSTLHSYHSTFQGITFFCNRCNNFISTSYVVRLATCMYKVKGHRSCCKCVGMSCKGEHGTISEPLSAEYNK